MTTPLQHCEHNDMTTNVQIGYNNNGHDRHTYKYNNLSLVEKYLSMKSIPTLGSLQEEGENNESNSSTQMELESIPV